MMDVSVPLSISDVLEGPPSDTHVIEGELMETQRLRESASEPTGLCYIHFPRDKPSYGVRWSSIEGEHLILEHNEDYTIGVAQGRKVKLPVARRGGGGCYPRITKYSPRPAFLFLPLMSPIPLGWVAR